MQVRSSIVEYLKFPQSDIDGWRYQQSYYQGAIVCRRAHVIYYTVNPDERVNLEQKCSTCGARVIWGCLSCGTRIRGDHFVPGVLMVTPYTPPPFCDDCGAAHPWATIKQRIYELENILDEEPDIAEVDKLFIGEQLALLHQLEAGSDRAEKVWRTIARRAGSFLLSEKAQPIISTLTKVGIDAVAK